MRVVLPITVAKLDWDGKKDTEYMVDLDRYTLSCFLKRAPTRDQALDLLKKEAESFFPHSIVNIIKTDRGWSLSLDNVETDLTLYAIRLNMMP